MDGVKGRQMQDDVRGLVELGPGPQTGEKEESSMQLSVGHSHRSPDPPLPFPTLPATPACLGIAPYILVPSEPSVSAPIAKLQSNLSLPSRA